jgi:hypothetical protein
MTGSLTLGVLHSGSCNRGPGEATSHIDVAIIVLS